MSWAKRFNDWRVFPRLFSILFCYLLWVTHQWYVFLIDPTTQQTGYASTMLAAAVGFFKFYTSSGTPNPTDTSGYRDTPTYRGAPPDDRSD